MDGGYVVSAGACHALYDDGDDARLFQAHPGEWDVDDGWVVGLDALGVLEG